MPQSNAGTKRVLRDMLTENTGIALLDSGDAYGRHWQHNQGRDFDNEPRVALEFRAYEPTKYSSGFEISYTRSTYWFLLDCLTFDAPMDRRFQRWAKRVDPQNERGWLDLMESFTDYLEDASGLYGDGKPFGDNTYNHDNNIDQTLQFEYFEVDKPYVLLQIHGGCDVRGGYTRPRVFRINDDAANFLSIADGSITCDHCEHYWSTDDTCHWYYESCTAHPELRLDAIPALSEDSTVGWLCAFEIDHGRAIDFKHLHETYGTPEHFALVRANHSAICPICGQGTLKAY